MSPLVLTLLGAEMGRTQMVQEDPGLQRAARLAI